MHPLSLEGVVTGIPILSRSYTNVLISFKIREKNLLRLKVKIRFVFILLTT
jgi:hypothetical protein